MPKPTRTNSPGWPNAPRWSHVEAHGILPDGSYVEVELHPDYKQGHDAQHGRYFLDVAGDRWIPLREARTTTDSRHAAGPGWYEPWPYDKEPPED